ncbi:MAG: hypothetical protein PHO88_03830 [Clostridia bacterium]|nr:hypothetical protein [Clostridia bacterium]
MYKLILLICATITFVILGFVTTMKHNNVKQLDNNIDNKKDK